LLQERKGTRAPQPFVLPPQNIYALHSPSLESRKRKNTSSPTHSCATLEIFVFNMSIKKYINTAQSAVKHFFFKLGLWMYLRVECLAPGPGLDLRYTVNQSISQSVNQ
jgi:hypothetical protein